MTALLDRLCAVISPVGERADEIELATARTALAVRARQNMATIRVSLLASLVVFAAMAPLAPVPALLAWLAGNNLALGWAAVVSSQLLPLVDRADAAGIARMEAKLFAILLVSTSSFASGLWWLGRPGAPADPAFVVTILLVMRLVTVMVSHSTHPRALYAALAVGAGTAAVYWVSAGGAGLAICASVFGVVALIARFASIQRPIFERNVRAAYENAELVTRLGAANAAKSRFLAAASHDLRQPIHALVLFSDALGRSARPDQSEIVLDIRHAVSSLDKLLGGLLDLSQIDAGAVKTNSAPYALGPWLEEIAKDFRQAAAEKGLTLSVQATDVWVRSDAFLLERVVRNLLDNAIKYTETGAVGVSCGVDEERVSLEVWDTGVGIPADAVPLAFEEFSQLDNPQRDPSRGAGLGLTIVRRLCGILDHPLQVQSAPGEGSTFIVTLPRAPLPPEPPAPVVAAGFVPSDAVRGKRVVVLDDDPRVRAAMRSLLESWGVDARVVATADQLHAALRSAQAPPDALIVDFRLAEPINGFEVIEQVQTSYGAVPAAVFTGESESSLPIGEAAANVPVFVKPVRPEEIGAWLEDALAPSARD